MALFNLNARRPYNNEPQNHIIDVGRPHIYELVRVSKDGPHNRIILEYARCSPLETNSDPIDTGITYNVLNEDLQVTVLFNTSDGKKEKDTVTLEKGGGGGREVWSLRPRKIKQGFVSFLKGLFRR